MGRLSEKPAVFVFLHIPLPVHRHRKNSRTCFEGPFGEVIRASGPMAKANPFRFSSKYQDDESELIYYGYRYYTASTGRWLSRDPIQEQGGNNLYGFAVNSPVTAIDADGRLSFVAIAVGAAVITIAADVVITAWLNSMERSRNTGHVKLDISGNTITVKPCQIVVFIGHGTQGRGWRFNVPNPEQSGAAFVGCNPQGVNGTIPKQALLAGAPMHNEDMGSIPSAIVKKYKDNNFSYSAITAFHISQDLIDRIVDQPLEYHMEAVVPAVEKAARARARSICSAKPCPCRSVEIIVYNYDAPLGELPSTYKLTYSCGKSAQ